MSLKRSAGSDLNQDNWANDEEHEEMGTYKTAPANELKMRAIKRAKRRGATGDREGNSIFSGFKGFGAASSDCTPAFSFLSDDANKPKLVCSNSFPSFSFNKSLDSTKADDKLNSKDASQEKPTVPSSNFTTHSSESKNDSEKESPPKPTFKFGVNADKTSNKSDKALLSSFNFNPSKTTDNSLNKPSGETGFKFGVDSKENKSSDSQPAKSFQFGIPSSNKIDVRNSASVDDEKSSDNEVKEPKIPNGNGMKGSPDSSDSKKSNLFLANLKALNNGVLKWVQQHLDKNQYLNLTPIFEDYKAHFHDIKKKFDNSGGESSCSSPSLPSDKSAQKPSASKDNSNSSGTFTSQFTFGSSNAKGNKTEPLVFSSSGSTDKISDSSKLREPKPFNIGLSKDMSKNDDKPEPSNKAAVPLFSFGKDNQTSVLSFNSSESKPTFSFGATESNSSNKLSKFSFGGTESNSSNKLSKFSFGATESNSSNKLSKFSFGVPKDNKSGFSFQKSGSPAPTTGFFTSNPPEASANESNKETVLSVKEGGDSSDVIPEQTVTEIKEEGAVYEKKVKLFYKKGKVYATFGVGTLFLKPVGEKILLIVRTSTNTGIILLNIYLSESMPSQRVGKNNVMIVCIPNPPIGKIVDTPVSILIRVKTESDADELLEQINKYKNN